MVVVPVPENGAAGDAEQRERIDALQRVVDEERESALRELQEAARINERLSEELVAVRAERDAYASRRLVRCTDAFARRVRRH